jgi:phosphatidylglycerophosphate synthase
VLAAAAAGLALAELTSAAAARTLRLSPGFVVEAGAFFLAVMLVAAARLAAHHPHTRFGPANTVTSLRLAFVAVLAAAIGEAHTAALAWSATVLAAVTSVLDGVDGWLARRTSLHSAFGARFDMEIDALLIMVLAALAWRWDSAGAWVLACGLMRYVFVAAAWGWPWLARPLPSSLRRKFVAVLQMVGLTIVVAPVVRPPLSEVLAAATLATLVWSFAVDVRWLAVRRAAPRLS